MTSRAATAIGTSRPLIAPAAARTVGRRWAAAATETGTSRAVGMTAPCGGGTTVPCGGATTAPATGETGTEIVSGTGTGSVTRSATEIARTGSAPEAGARKGAAVGLLVSWPCELVFLCMRSCLPLDAERKFRSRSVSPSRRSSRSPARVRSRDRRRSRSRDRRESKRR